ncbi:MAG: putative Fe-S cluster assembly protein SufT [Nevskia sp.]|jgi:probable FeS assembly SUF system protein SufT|nr:putative Fe-S cluster assembly protein SufT [Gammaproteobacteria bacterium]MDH4459749.1 putative Fe-S cluster assembly protein SufT [Nevskia sp.]
MSYYNHQTVSLTRDVIGVLIPAGTRVELPTGAEATITQALGGSYTVEVQGHLFRIDGKDADALGMQPTDEVVLAADASEDEVAAAVRRQLETVYDPEIPINIVELGLIYDSRLEPAEDNGWKLHVVMTLTAPGCGMGDVLVSDVKTKAMQVPGVREADVELTFDPPWSQSMMSDSAKLQAGFL